MVYRADLYTVFWPKGNIVTQVLGHRLCVCVCRCLHACVHVVYRADLYTVFKPKEDIVGHVLGPRLCVCVCECRYLHTSMHVVYTADFYTVFGPKADIVGQVLSPKLCVCVCVRACVCVCDQLSAQVVFMKLPENLFFKVVLDFYLLPHPRHGPWDRCFEVILCDLGPSMKAV